MVDSSTDSVDTSADSVSDKKSQDKVAYETYSKVLAEAKNAKAKVKEYEAERQVFSDNKLKEQNEWKSLAEAKEKALHETTHKLNELEGTILRSVKINAFQRHLGGRIKDDAYYQFVDVDKIAYNPETQRVDEDSVKGVVSDFVKRHSSLVEFKQGKMPNEAPKQESFKAKKVSEMNSSEIEAELRKLGKI